MNKIYLIKQETLNNIAAVTRQKMGAAAEETIRITELAQKIENIPTTNITQTPELIEFAKANIFNSSHYDDYDKIVSDNPGGIIQNPDDFNPTLLDDTQYIIQIGQLNQNAPLTSYIDEIKDNECPYCDELFKYEDKEYGGIAYYGIFYHEEHLI